MKKLYGLLMLLLAISVSRSATYQWNNAAGGNWFANGNWTPASVPGPGDTANITLAGTYTVTIATGTVTVASLNLGAASGTQTLLHGTINVIGMTNGGTVGANGVLVVTNQGLRGSLTIQPGGQMQITNSGGKQFYALALTNNGTVTWNDGSISVGGSSGETTTIINSGLWQITGDSPMNYGGGFTPTFVNSGTVTKTAGTGSTFFTGLTFANQPAGQVAVSSGTLVFNVSNTNSVAGNFVATSPGMIKLNTGTWTDAGGTFSGTGTNQLAGGTLLLRTNLVPGLQLLGGDVFVSTPFQAGGTITNLTLDGANLRGTNTLNNGTLTINSGNLLDKLTILPAGQLLIQSNGGKQLYSTTIINQGIVSWNGGSLSVGSTPPTLISNGGLWLINGDLSMSFGGGLTPNWTNSGILRKTTGSGLSQVDGFNFINQPGSLVESLSGTIRFTGAGSNILGGTFNAAGSGLVEIASGTWTDAGGTTTASGSGTNRFNGGTFNYRTNTIPGLRHTGGNVFITGTTTFQQAGTITNLTLDGATLAGTNAVGPGTLTLNSGAMSGQLTVLPGGQLSFATAGSKALSFLTLLNQGTVLWSGGSLSASGTPGMVVSNGGLWQMTSDDTFFYGGVGTFPVLTNSGTVLKSGGAGTSATTGIALYNQPGGLVQVDTGFLQLSSIAANSAGTERLNGGRLTANGTLAFTGGTLDGTGSVGANSFTGGIISPGQGGPGRISFTSGLSLGTGTTLVIDGIGNSPGTQYDQLSVTGSVSLANSILQVNALPPVLAGGAFVIIDNDGSDPVTGTFNGLPENSLMVVSGQPFRIHYAGGTGNDVTLVRDPTAQLFSNGILTNGTWQFSGTGAPSASFVIQATTNFLQWTNVGFATGNISGTFLFHDTNAFRFPYRFYRTSN